MLNSKVSTNKKKPKMIYVNARFLTQKVTGVQRFAIEIIKRIKNALGNDIQLVSPSNIIQEDLAKELDTKIIGKTKGHLWEQITLPYYLHLKGAPLLLNFCNTAPVTYSNSIVTIHDLAALAYPSWFSIKYGIAYKLLMPLISKKSKGIITVSSYSKNEIHNILNIKKDKINIVHCAISINLKKTESIMPKSNYILFVGSIDPRKNIERLIKSMAFLPEKISLIIVGGKNNIFNQQNFNCPENIRNRIEFTGYVTDEMLEKLYNNAKVFIYPSLYEGFGIPPLEAQACGCPVVCSNATSLPEVCGNSVLYCDPYNINDISAKIKMVLDDEKLQRNLIAKGFENIKRFSWEASSKKIIEIIRNIN